MKSLYSWQKIDADIKTFNKASVFLMHNESEYKIEKKQYPEPFPLLIAIENNTVKLNSNIDTTKVYLEYEDSYFQFYKVNEELLKKENNTASYSGGNYYDFKYRLVKDVSDFKELLHPSLYNYSKELFTVGQDSVAYKKQIQSHEEILNRGDELEIKSQLETLISLAVKYKLKHNLEVDEWFELVNNKPNYLLKELINTSDNFLYNNYSNVVEAAEATVSKTYKSGRVEFENNNIPYSKKLYYDTANLDNFFGNVHEAYFPKSEKGTLYFFIIFSFILGLLLFIFKTTSTKSILLSFVASLVILVLVVWLMSSISSIVTIDGFRAYREYFVMMFISFLVLLFSLISYVKKWKKIKTSILWSLNLFAVPILFMFSCFTYIEYLENAHLAIYINDYSYKSNFEIWFETYGFWLILFVSFVTVYVYSRFIRGLKARPQ